MVLEELINIFGIQIPAFLLLVIGWSVFGVSVAIYFFAYILPMRNIAIDASERDELQPEEALEEIVKVIRRTVKPKPRLVSKKPITGDDLWNIAKALARQEVATVIDVGTKKKSRFPKIRTPRVVSPMVPVVSHTPVQQKKKREEKDWEYSSEPP